MANSITATMPELWSAEMQDVFYKTNVGLKICENVKGEITKYGDTLHRVARGSVYVVPVTTGSDIDGSDLSATDETLLIDQKWGTRINISDSEVAQSKYDLAMYYGKDCAEAVSNKIDADILYQVVNATSVVDNSDFGGTAGDGITISTSNVLNIFTKARRKLKKQNITSNDVYAVISPEFEETLIDAVASRDTIQGDEVGKNGFIGTYFGVKMFVSNNLTSTAVLGMATNPTDGDTMVIDGVTFTFVSSIGTTPGNILIAGSADATRANAAALINAPATTTANGVALSTANARTFTAYISAVNDNTANTLTVTGKGRGVLNVSETLTAGGDTWTAALQLQRVLFGVMGNPCIAMQMQPSIDVRQEPKQKSSNYLIEVLYGVKTFADNAKNMVDVKVRCDTYN